MQTSYMLWVGMFAFQQQSWYPQNWRLGETHSEAESRLILTTCKEHWKAVGRIILKCMFGKWVRVLWFG